MEKHHKYASILYEVKQIEFQIRSVKEDINSLKQEMEILRLEQKWGIDSAGNRTVPTAEDQAVELSQKLVDYPFLVEDTVKALRLKKIDLQSDLKELVKRSSDVELSFS
ncbi:hypothetical protein PoB_006215400 [Plakobranchus ocellatus]|uniref:Uncharacterized protein n=1 Tax=Plakobranchus ocellatus TaxID=259542 RepID=A0AAV4CUU0_9GAST|nr:hypothetical protein PoB_006215400 [Plakobranchus ocellatus]